MPTETEEGALIFKLVRSNHLDDSPIPVEPQHSPSVLLWMPSMGHGSTPTSTERIDVGSFRVKNVFFIMPGEWEIRFHIREGSTIHDEAVVLINL